MTNATSEGRSPRSRARDGGRDLRGWLSRRKAKVIAGLVVLFHVLGLLGSVNAVMTARTAQGAIAWAVSLNTFPYVAVPAYWVFGRRKFEGYVESFQKHDAQLRRFVQEFRSRLAPYEIAREERVPDYEALKTLARSPLLGRNDVELLIDGEATFDSIIEGIGRARESVLVEFYIVRDDGLGRRLQQALIAKAREGVRVLFLYDEIGSHGLTQAYRTELQEAGAEVVHLGHNRRVEEIVAAAIQEDVDAVAISSYQGGHTEFFGYLVDALAERGGGHIRVFGGGGGTITSEEAEALEAGGVSRIYAPEHGKRLGLRGMIQDMLTRLPGLRPTAVLHADPDQPFSIARTLSHIERGGAAPAPRERSPCPVLGVTGTGGAGKSSVVDELLFRLLRAWPDRRFALLAIDPTRHRSGGALLGDRIRMNSVHGPRVYMRSMATRRKHRATNAALPECIAFLRHAGFDLVIVETAGTGQGDAEIAELVDLSLYVMTSDYGAPSQLEKIQMLDYADLVALNKSDKQGAEDALREVQRQLARGSPDAQVTATVASRHNDRGITGLCRQLSARLEKIDGRFDSIPAIDGEPTGGEALIPAGRVRYLGEISETGRRVRAHIDHQCAAATRAQHLYDSLREVGDSRLPEPLEHYAGDRTAERSDVTLDRLRRAYEEALGGLDSDSVSRLREWPTRRQGYRNAEYVYRSGGRELRGENFRQSLSRLAIPKLALPRVEAWGELLRFLLEENLPGAYPYTAGVFSYRRSGEDPTRMFAGEGTPERTNRRFHYLAAGQPAVRLSTAFDPVALYGEDPDARPDIYGRVGMSGVSVATLDDMKKLYSGFDLCAQNTSVSMTINGPAPIMLAWFLNVAVDQQRSEEHTSELQSH